MTSHKLPNYLRVYRKRLGLSQNEVAFLLGWRNASQPSRYEHFSRVPTLRTALALSVIFQASVRELFSGEYQKVETAVCRQAQRLEARLTTENPDQPTAGKLALLKTIISADDNRS
jgi:transcriptional regulator with XRE-family HTH domain